eukprot:8704464-Pyramimonas_sp.AAC.1
MAGLAYARKAAVREINHRAAVAQLAERSRVHLQDPTANAVGGFRVAARDPEAVGALPAAAHPTPNMGGPRRPLRPSSSGCALDSCQVGAGPHTQNFRRQLGDSLRN